MSHSSLKKQMYTMYLPDLKHKQIVPYVGNKNFIKLWKFWMILECKKPFLIYHKAIRTLSLLWNTNMKVLIPENYKAASFLWLNVFNCQRGLPACPLWSELGLQFQFGRLCVRHASDNHLHDWYSCHKFHLLWGRALLFMCTNWFVSRVWKPSLYTFPCHH